VTTATPPGTGAAAGNQLAARAAPGRSHARAASEAMAVRLCIKAW
jgi:hypothetical protein